MLLARNLHEAITRAEIAGIRNAIEATRRLAPAVGAEAIEIAGGLVAFTGIDSPLSQAYGVGVFEPASAGDVERITTFFSERGATPRVFVAPLADATLGSRLAAAGYAPAEYENVLVSDDLDAHARRDDRVGAARDLEAWARASAQAFMDAETLGPGDDLIAAIIASSDRVLALELRDGDRIAATAAMDSNGEWAALFAASTMPAYRNRGLHVALIRDRIARAHDAGARFLRATARPGSTSERNFRRCGFTMLYTRSLWERQ